MEVFVRVCKDYKDLDWENLQLYSLQELKDEAVAIDYVDGDIVDDISIDTLMEVFERNNEKILRRRIEE